MDIIYNILTSNGIVPLEYYIRIIIASILGFLIGIDRIKKYKPIGIKTFTLISTASALVTILSISSIPSLSQAGETMMDPMRLVAQLLPAVGFVGAGAIISSKNKVTGLTSAAFVLFAAVIGVGIGIGFYGITIFAFLSIFLFLKSALWLEKNKFIENENDDEYSDKK